MTIKHDCKRMNSSQTCLIIFLLLTGLLSVQPVLAQMTLKGVLNDSEGQTVPYVPIAILNAKDSSLIKVGVSDSIGQYIISFNHTGPWLISVNYLGYTPYFLKVTDDAQAPGGIRLLKSSTVLGAVTIISKEPVIERKIDRMIFHPGSLLSTAGDNAYETLKKAPAIYADETGNISINGLAGAGIMINGRLLQLSGEQAMDYLKSIPASEIQSIEIISNPSSKYDAEGLSGLVNIVLKKNQREGLTGSVSVYSETTQQEKGGANIDLNYRKGKFNVFGGASCRMGRYYSLEQIDNIYNRDVNPYYYSEAGNRFRDQLNSLCKLGADYTIKKEHILGFRLENSYTSRTGTENRKSTFKTAQDKTDSLYSTDINYENYSNTFSGNLNYTATLDTAGQSLNVDLDYTNYRQPKLGTTTSSAITNSIGQKIENDIIFKNQSDQNLSIYSSKIDYSKPVGSKILFETGTKYYFLQNENHLQYFTGSGAGFILDNSKSNSYQYTESNLAFYLNFNHKLNDHWNYQVGVRNENTDLMGTSANNTASLNQQYTRFFPTGFLQYSRNDNNEFGLNFSRRINRPDYANLNPFRYYTSPNSYIEGNPFLQAALTNSIDISYTRNKKYFFDLFTYLTDGQITQVPVLNAQNNSYKYVSVNLDHSFNTGLNVYVPIKVYSWWQSTLSVTAGLNGVHSVINNQDYVYQNFTVNVITNNQFTLSAKRRMFAEINFIYQPAGASQGLFI
ncbi:MAG: TonB-dependent receptor domain-containing protein, partial [Bacteroidia bacterium]